MLTNIALENFRNYKSAEVKFDYELVLILGDNASGKTNFLESIYYLSALESFRTIDSLLVKKQEDYFKITGNYFGSKYEVGVQVNPSTRRSYKINDIKTKKLVWQSFNTVLFVPQDLNLFSLGPQLRRKYLNDTLIEFDKFYAADLAVLDHVLKQKAALLSEINLNPALISQLEFWNDQLAEVALRISKVRRDFIDYLNINFAEVYKFITGFENGFEIKYKGAEALVNKEQYLKILENYKDAEVNSGLNLIGPHRDDFQIFKDDIINTNNSSQGELRSQILAIKLLQAKYLSQKSKPIILLDDVFSELDEIRRSKLIENLKDFQIFITSTEEHHLPKIENVQILKVQNGEIK